MPSPIEITVSQLSHLIGTPEAPIVIDVRIDVNIATDPQTQPTLPCPTEDFRLKRE